MLIVGRAVILSTLFLTVGVSNGDEISAEALSKRVKIYRDSFGVPHIDAEDQTASAFAIAYAQAEDYFWQVEDSIAWGTGRYAELYGESKVDDDLTTHAFGIPRRSETELDTVPAATRKMGEAFAAGLNHYLAKHPEVKPRLFTKFEPWHLLAFGRRVYLEIVFKASHVGGRYRPGPEDEIYEQVGSNAWAVAPSKTKAGTTMLFINPHQPWYGYGQWYEAHVRTKDGIDFYGASFFCSPALSIGHNQHCGWTFTFNAPDAADVWNVRFDDPSNPNAYRHGDKLRVAETWTQDIKIKGFPTRRYAFRKTHHGPVLRKVGDDGKTFEVVGVPNLFENDFLGQILSMNRAKNVHELKNAMSSMHVPIFNCVAADSEGNISYLYNAAIPKRDPRFNWEKPVDGNDPATDWKGLHSIDELPQVLNPPDGYVQNCNSSPFTTADDGNPFKDDFPSYMVLDKDVDSRRAKISRHLLRKSNDLTLDDYERLAFDTTLYWALDELPRLRLAYARLKKTQPELAERVKDYMTHFDGWNCTASVDSTVAPLCAQWYEELYGFGTSERLKDEYKENPDRKFVALETAAKKLIEHYGTWKPRWGDIYRIQRHANVADLLKLPLSDAKPSLPCPGAPGALGTVFTIYSSPSVYVPILREMRKHYAVVGSSYMGVVEFGPQGVVGTRSLIQFGSSSDPKSPHFTDQAELMSQSKMKRTLFDWDEIRSTATRSYVPGEESVIASKSDK